MLLQIIGYLKQAVSHSKPNCQMCMSVVSCALIDIIFTFFTAYRIHISNFTYLELVKIGGYMIEKRGLIPVKVSV